MNPLRFASDATRRVRLTAPPPLESGVRLPVVEIAYRTWGRLDDSRSNAVVVCHALTGSADVDRWWAPLLGPGRALDPDRDFIVCANVLGGCYGSTGPTSTPPGADAPYGPDFPAITVRDIVAAHRELLRALGVRRVRLVVGGSLGGMQVLEWGFSFPELVEAIAPIAASGRHSAWCIGWSEAQRAAIAADPRWRGGRYPADDPPAAGLAAARAVAMCTYRSHASFEQRFGRHVRADDGAFEVATWLRHHGEDLVGRFDANTYVALTRAMDTHDLARDRGRYEDVLQSFDRPALVISIDSDALYPPVEQEELRALLPRAQLVRIDSPHGHDGFLIDAAAVNDVVLAFRERLAREARPSIAFGG